MASIQDIHALEERIYDAVQEYLGYILKISNSLEFKVVEFDHLRNTQIRK